MFLAGRDQITPIACCYVEAPLALIRKHWHSAFYVELVILAITGPILYLSSRAGWLAVLFALIALAAGWFWRRVQVGVWYQSTPTDWPVAWLFLVMLPIAVWVAPDSLRGQGAWPRAFVLLWNLQLFVVIVTYVSRYPRLLPVTLVMFVSIAVLFALVAPFGTKWLFKLPGTEAVLSRIPSVLSSFSREGGNGFHPNIVAGALLYVLPLMISLSVAGFIRKRRGLKMWFLAGATLYVLGIFVLLQSRSGYIGLAAALLAMALIHYRWGRWSLAVAVAVVVTTSLVGGNRLVELVAENPTVEAVGGVATLANFRVYLWTYALKVIGDYPFTGVGLGSFQDVVSRLYSLDIPSSFYFGHAHNFWLQGALDFGIPGLIAILAIYLTAVVQLVRIWPSGARLGVPGLVTGLFGSLLAQSLFSLTDSLSLGTTANLLFWFLFALIFAVGNILTTADHIKR